MLLYRAFIHHRQFRYLGALYLHSLIYLFATSIFAVFSSIYVFQIFRGLGLLTNQSLALTATFFAIYFLVHALATAPALWFINRKGLRFSVFWGNMFLIAYFVLLSLSKLDPFLLIIAALAGGIQVGLYWTAYHMFFSELTDDQKQGKEIALGSSLSTVAAIGGPAFGGLIIAYLGFNAIFIVMTILIILANFPLRYLPKTKDQVNFDVLAIIEALSPKKEKRSYLALFGVAAVDCSNIFWPIYVLPILAGFIGIGLMGSLATFSATIGAVLVGLLIDKFGPKKVSRIFSPLDSILWATRTLVSLPVHVYGIVTAQALTVAGQYGCINAAIYERARHKNIAAFIVQREVGLSISYFLFLMLAGILLWFGMPLVFIFLISALAALLPTLYPKSDNT
ncbi:MAG: MFS transporter [Patescibacteria group bacterium]|nr:MFS transporter [Patescibacteria group bacterium]